MVVDIILPVYNTGGLLENALTSIVNQTYTDWHCYIVDDGSTDNTASILSKYSTNERFTLIKNSENMGIAYSLNKAISTGNSEYIARLDADDMWHTNHLELLVGYLNTHNDIDVVGSLVSTVSREEFKENISCTLPSKEYTIRKSDVLYKGIIQSNQLNHPSVVFRRSAFLQVGGYDERHSGFEDWELWYKLLSPTNGAVLEVPTLYYYTGKKNKPPKKDPIFYGKEFMKFKSMLKRQKR